jgi:hypothetical protein
MAAIVVERHAMVRARGGCGRPNEGSAGEGNAILDVRDTGTKPLH